MQQLHATKNKKHAGVLIERVSFTALSSFLTKLACCCARFWVMCVAVIVIGHRECVRGRARSKRKLEQKSER